MGDPRCSIKSRAFPRLCSGQVMLEFVFSLMVVLLLLYAVVKVFSWTGSSLVERRKAHDQKLTTPISEEFNPSTQMSQGPLNQIDPFYYKKKKVRAVWGE